MDEIIGGNNKLQMIADHISEENQKKLLAAKAKIQKEVCILVDISKSKTQNGQRNVLNKWFQDSIKNYFLEVFAAPLILEDLGMKTADQVKHYIHQSVANNDAKFMLLLNKYYQELSRFGKLLEFRKSLEDLVLSSLEDDQLPLDKSYFSYNRQKTIRKRFVGLLLLVFCACKAQNKEITSFYDIWNETFPDDQKYKKKLSKYDTIRLKKANQDVYKDNQITMKHQKSNDNCDSKICKTLNLTISNQTDPVTDDSLKTKLSCLLKPTAQAKNYRDISNRDQSKDDLADLQPISNISLRVDSTLKENCTKQFTSSYRYLDSAMESKIQPENQGIHDTIKISEKSAQSSNLFSEYNSTGQSSLKTGLTFRSIIDVVASAQNNNSNESLTLQKIQTATFKCKPSKIHKEPINLATQSLEKEKSGSSSSSKKRQIHHSSDFEDQRKYFFSNTQETPNDKKQPQIALTDITHQTSHEDAHNNIGKAPAISLVENNQPSQNTPGTEEFLKNQGQIGQQIICSDYTSREMSFSVSSTNSLKFPATTTTDNYQLSGIPNFYQLPSLFPTQILGFPNNTIEQKYLQNQPQLTQLPFYQSFGALGQNIIMNLYQWQSTFHQ